MQINVFNPFTYTLETIIQSGNRNLGVQSVPVRTNAPTRPSRLYRGTGTYLRKSMATIFRIYTLYKPLKTFFLIGTLLILAGAAIGGRFLWFFFEGDRAGHIQSLILAAVFLIVGFQTLLIGLVADLISVNRRLSEEVLIRLRKSERSRFPRERHQPAAAQPKAEAETKWVWLIDEDKLEDSGITPPPPPEEEQQQPSGNRRRRRRRGGMRQRPELPGNRGKHLNE